MGRIVMKFGGTSVADVERIERVARLVKAEAAAGNSVAVVVSAMAGETNRLVGLVDAISESKGADTDANSDLMVDDEYDVVVASGEQVTSGLLALALRRRGVDARSWLGWQIPLKTGPVHAKARIADIEADKLGEIMDAGTVAVVAGFQGVAPSGRISTLGRGGSDTSAVALAVALNAERCDIYTDVDGVYTTDPRIEEKARRLDRITFEEMLEMASLGAKVLQTRSVELAMRNEMPIRVLTSFTEPGEDNPGTLVCSEDEILEEQIVNGVAYSRDEAKVSLFELKDEPGVVAHVFDVLAEAQVNVDMIVQGASRTEGRANLVFTVGKRDLAKTKAVLEEHQGELGFSRIGANENVTKVSIIGIGMKSHVGVAQTMFKALSERGINIEVISTSEIKISVLINAEYTELAVRALHGAFELAQR